MLGKIVGGWGVRFSMFSWGFFEFLGFGFVGIAASILVPLAGPSLSILTLISDFFEVDVVV